MNTIAKCGGSVLEKSSSKLEMCKFIKNEHMEKKVVKCTIMAK